MKTLLILSMLLGSFALQAHAASVLAKVGPKEITDEDIRAEYDMLDKDQKKAVNGDAATRKNIVESAVNSELLLQAAVKNGYEGSAEYKRALDRFRKQFLATKMMEKTVEPKLTKDGIRKFYDANKGLFDSSQACASHVVVSDEATAKKVIELLKAPNAKFEEIAKKYSNDPTVQDNGGNLGCFTRDRMVPEFSAAAFSMKKGEVKGPVKTMYGMHVIKVNDFKPGKTPGYDEVEQRAKDAYRMKILQDTIAELRSKSAVNLNDDAIKNFKF